MAQIKTTRLYRSVGSEELELIKQSDSSAFPPRLPEQPIFYPVLTEEYARQIAREGIQSELRSLCQKLAPVC